MWLSADLEKGDEFGFDGYATSRIDTITADGTITLLDTWRGPTLSGSPYFIRYQADGSGLTGQSIALRRMLSQPLLTAFAGITAVADKLMYFTGANTMALVDFKGWARSLLGLTPAANKSIYFTDANTAATYDLTAAGRALLDDANASAQLDTLGFSAFIKTLIDDANSTAARTTLGAQTALGYTPVQQGTGAGQTSNIVKLGWNGANALKATIDFTDLGRIWADFEAGRSLTSNGYQKFPGGLILQWGSVAGAPTDYAQAFPIAFPIACFSVVIIPNFNTAAITCYGVNTSNIGTTSFDIRARNMTNGGILTAQGNLPVVWMAVGI
ncbi:hypothetical protein ABIC60_002660 [Phyllobacterium ifriqiyense]